MNYIIIAANLCITIVSAMAVYDFSHNFFWAILGALAIGGGASANIFVAFLFLPAVELIFGNGLSIYSGIYVALNAVILLITLKNVKSKVSAASKFTREGDHYVVEVPEQEKPQRKRIDLIDQLKIESAITLGLQSVEKFCSLFNIEMPQKEDEKKLLLSILSQEIVGLTLSILAYEINKPTFTFKDGECNHKETEFGHSLVDYLEDKKDFLFVDQYFRYTHIGRPEAPLWYKEDERAMSELSFGAIAAIGLNNPEISYIHKYFKDYNECRNKFVGFAKELHEEIQKFAKTTPKDK